MLARRLLMQARHIAAAQGKLYGSLRDGRVYQAAADGSGVTRLSPVTPLQRVAPYGYGSEGGLGFGTSNNSGQVRRYALPVSDPATDVPLSQAAMPVTGSTARIYPMRDRFVVASWSLTGSAISTIAQYGWDGSSLGSQNVLSLGLAVDRYNLNDPWGMNAGGLALGFSRNGWIGEGKTLALYADDANTYFDIMNLPAVADSKLSFAVLGSASGSLSFPGFAPDAFRPIVPLGDSVPPLHSRRMEINTALFGGARAMPFRGRPVVLVSYRALDLYWDGNYLDQPYPLEAPDYYDAWMHVAVSYGMALVELTPSGYPVVLRLLSRTRMNYGTGAYTVQILTNQRRVFTDPSTFVFNFPSGGNAYFTKPHTRNYDPANFNYMAAAGLPSFVNTAPSAALVYAITGPWLVFRKTSSPAGLFRTSVDGSEGFSAIAPPGAASPVDGAIFLEREGVLIVRAGGGATPTTVHQSHDGGFTWASVPVDAWPAGNDASFPLATL